jgi:hypothetical protein
MTQPLDLAPIQARADAATPGPWWNDGHEIAIYQGEPGGPGDVWIGETCTTRLPDWGNANAAFIAAARQDVPALLAEVTRLREINRRLDDSLKRALLAADEDPATCLCCGHLESAHDPDGDRDCHASGARVMTCVCTSFIPCYPAPADDRYEGVCFVGTGAPAAQEG